MHHATIRDGITSARLDINRRLAIHEHLDMEAVMIITIIHPEGNASPVFLGILYLVVKNRA